MNIMAKKFNKAIRLFTDKQEANQRYASFDYCYGYFQGFKNKRDIASAAKLEHSCLVISFYLASWGMFRGSSFLLQRSSHFFIPLVKWIAVCDKTLWNIDIDEYSDIGVRESLLDAYSSVQEHLGGDKTNPSKTLVTKVMLGVFGNIPAFDQYFCGAFKMHTVNDKNLRLLGKFYNENKKIVDSVNIKCFNFNSGKQTGLLYPKAKIVDMYGFIAGN